MNFFHTVQSIQKRIGTFLVVLFMCVVVVMPTVVFGADVPAESVNFGLSNVDSGIALSNDTSIIEIITNIIRVMLGLLGILVVGLILYAGFMWMTANGNEERIATAKRILTNGVIGLAIILSAFAITQFVIRSLSDATGSGNFDDDNTTITDCTEEGGCTNTYCSRFGSDSVCTDETFFVKSITPSTDGEYNTTATHMNDAVVRVLFSRPIASGQINSAVTITSETGSTIDTIVTARAGNRILEIVPNTPERTWEIGRYDVSVQDNVTDYEENRIEDEDVRGTRYPLSTQFYISALYDDRQAPEVTALTINGEDTPDALYIGDTLKVNLNTTDRATIPTGRITPVGGIGIATITIRSGARIIYTHRTGPQVRNGSTGGSSVAFNTEYVQTITAADFPSRNSYTIDIEVQDINGNSTSTSRTFPVYIPECNNGILDPGETDIDVGGPCGLEEGQACTIDAECSPFMQCIEGSCVANPIILDFDPDNAAANNWVTVYGRFFGDEPGTVEFGYPDDDEYVWVSAAAPDRLECPAGDLWQSTWTIVAVPEGELAQRDDIAIRITRAAEQDGDDVASDDTLDTRGTQNTFSKDTTERPGICTVLTTDDGRGIGTPGESVFVYGRGFIEDISDVYWGRQPGSISAFTSSNLVTSEVPLSFGNGVVGVRVQNGTSTSNGVPFTIRTSANDGDPIISVITPPTTTQKSYITLSGINFGSPYGTVHLSNTADNARACALGDAGDEVTCYALETELPSRCGIGWSATEVVVAVEDNTKDIPPGTYALVIKNVGGRISDGSDTLTVMDGNPLPSICKLSPNNGPAPLPFGKELLIIGKNFSSDVGDSVVRFWNTGSRKDIVDTGWLMADNEITGADDTKITTVFPLAEDGSTIPPGEPAPIMVQRADGLMSNAVSYTANTCTADTTLPVGMQCCTEGADAGRVKPIGYACSGDSKSAGYVWRFTSGNFPDIPRVLEQCIPGNTAVMPSPSPATMWDSGARACINALISVQFSETTIDTDSVNTESVRLFKCENGERRGCDRDVNLAVPHLSGATLDIYGRAGDADLEPDTWYTVELDRSIQTLDTRDIAGRTVTTTQGLLAARPCGGNTAYCFDFKTSALGDRCTMVDAFIRPAAYIIRELGPVRYSGGGLVNFNVYGQADQACISISARNIGWAWSLLDFDRDTVNNSDVEIHMVQPSWDDVRTLFAYNEAPNQPLSFEAVTTTEDDVTITASSTVTIALGAPEVVGYWPNCTAACSNATLGVRFNRNMITDDFKTEHVTVYNCGSSRTCDGVGSDDEISFTIPTDYITDRGFIIVPATPLLRDTWYKVEVRDMHAIGGYAPGEGGAFTAIAGDVIEPFEWGFKTKASFDGCFVDAVDVFPSSYVARVIGERNIFSAVPFGTPDECSPYGQQLNPFDYDWAWSIPVVPEAFKDVVTITTSTIAAQNAPGCSDNCTPLGSTIRRTAEAAAAYLCGNGTIDPGETCDIGMPGEVSPLASSDAFTCTLSCTRPGNANDGIGAGQCGNGSIENPQTTEGSTAGEACDAGDQNGVAGSGCSAVCTTTGSSETFSGDLEASYCSISEGVFDGVLDPGEDCEIGADGVRLVVRNASDPTTSRELTVENPKSYCTNTCQFTGTRLAQQWCDADGYRTAGACRAATSLCGNGVVETGEVCEIVSRGAEVSTIRVLTSADRANPLASTTITVDTETADRVCTSQCLLGDICDYDDEFLASSASGLWCDPREDEGCTAQCTLAGSSLGYTFLSQCRDDVVGTGEYAICEMSSASDQFTGPSQTATAVGESTEVNSSTQAQQSRIDVQTERYRFRSSTGAIEIADIDQSDRIPGSAAYFLQCGFEEFDDIVTTTADAAEVLDYNSCPGDDNGFSTGVASNSCCYPRPVASATYPEQYAYNVCRNTLMEVSFVDEIIDQASVRNNILLAKQIITADDRADLATGVPLPTCAEQGLTDVTDIVLGSVILADASDSAPRGFFGRIWHGITSFFARVVSVVFAYDTRTPATFGITADSVWCDASLEVRSTVQYLPNEDGTSGTSNIRANISRLLDAGTQYMLLLESGPDGIINDIGVPIQSSNNTSYYYSIPFETGSEICKITDITVTPEEHIFRQPNAEQTFVIEAVTNSGERLTPISNVYDWRYNWAPTLSDLFRIPVEPFNSTTDQGILGARDIEAQQTAQARIEIITDSATEVGDQTGRVFTANTNLYARFCANMWGGNAAGDPWRPYQNDRFNFQFWYCADAGSARSTADDLPLFDNIRESDLRTPEIEDVTCEDVEPEDGICDEPLDSVIERTFFFSTNRFNDDALGIQVFYNPNRETARAWYASNFGAIPAGYQTVTIDGYDAITNGTTYYINALNVQYTDVDDNSTTPDQISAVYSNIYQFSINEAAQEKTIEAFRQIIENLRFNTNMTDHGYCLQTEDSRRTETQLYNDQLSCSSDFDCRDAVGNPREGTSGICSNNRTALFNDIERLADISTIQQQLEATAAADPLGNYPALRSGTFYPGYSVSQWNSWQTIAGAFPRDPINRWTECGDPLSTNQQTCWDADESKYYCPAFSSVYEYKVNTTTDAYTVHAQFELLTASDPIVGDLLYNADTLETSPWCAPESTRSPFGNTCGDGIVQTEAREQCDPPGRQETQLCDGGLGVRAQTCTATCRLPQAWEDVECVPKATCGNGRVEEGEQCDAGDRNGVYGSGCTAPDVNDVGGCQIEGAPFCGNNNLDTRPDGTYYEYCEEVNNVCQYVFNNDTIERVYPELYFLIDHSGSMTSDFLESTRWDFVRNTTNGLPDLFGSLVNNVQLGFGVFSGRNSTDVLRGTKSFNDIAYNDAAWLANIIANLNTVGLPCNGLDPDPCYNADTVRTPSTEASVVNRTYLGPAIQKLIIEDDTFNTRSTDYNELYPRSLVLVVDGAENVADGYENAAFYIEQLLSEYNIRTYVIAVGSRHSNFTTWAEAGGSNDYYYIDDVDGFRDVVQVITGCSEYSLRPGNTCNNSCTGFGQYCGDGNINSAQGETCDDGNYVNGDGCDTYCRIESSVAPPTPIAEVGTCGDGVVQSPNTDLVREVCDLGDQNGVAPPAIYGERQTYCAADCSAVLTVDEAGYCGDGEVQEGELCDASGNDVYVWGYCTEPAQQNGQVGQSILDDDGQRIYCTENSACGSGNVCRKATAPLTAACTDSGELGGFSCVSSCQVVTNNCVSCDLHSATVGGIRNANIDGNSAVDIRFLNPLGNTIATDPDNSYLYRSNSLTFGLFGFNNISGDFSGSVFGTPNNSNYEPGSTGPYSFYKVLGNIDKQFGSVYARIDSTNSVYLESDALCSNEYFAYFGENSSVIYDLEPSARLPFSVNSGESILRDTMTVSPPLPQDQVRIVVRWEEYSFGALDIQFKGNLYSQHLSERLYTVGALDPSDICNDQVLSGEYYVPSCSTLGGGIHVHKHIIDQISPSTGNGIQSFTLDIDELYDGLGPSINGELDRRAAFYVTTDAGAINSYQPEGRVFVDVYTYREDQDPAHVYMPTYTFEIDRAQPSSNDDAVAWHVFNLVRKDGAVHVQLLDASETTYPLTEGITTDQITVYPVQAHGAIKTRTCEIQAYADRTDRVDVCGF